MHLSDDKLNEFKTNLQSILKLAEVDVVFTKRDGTDRVMKCTLNESKIPAPEIKESTEPKKEKKVNLDVLAVYDTEAQGWRSFRWDSLKTVTINVG